MRTIAGLAVISILSAPAWSQATKLLASDGDLYDEFGSSVAVSGTIALVGATRDQDNGGYSGSAYLFNLSTGVQYAKLLASDGAEGDVFGTSVGVSGATAVVGAPSSGGYGNTGSAYLFSATTGIEIAKLIPSDGLSQDDAYGTSVATNGISVVVGAPGDDDAAPDAGSAYVFDATTGVQIRKLLANDASAGDRFGMSVAVGSDTIAVGAVAPGSNVLGEAYIFDVSTGAQLLKLTPSDGAPGDRFAWAIAINENFVVVGAPFDEDNGHESGSAYVFDVTTGAQLWKLVPSDGGVGHHFGYSVAIGGTTVIVGARRDDFQGPASGSAYIFDAATGIQVEKVLAGDGTEFDDYGVSVAINGTTALIGAELDDDNGSDSGSAYLLNTSSPQVHTGYAYCFGDGTGAACPCGAIGSLGGGCAHTGGSGGAKLRGEGHASITGDTFWLEVQGAPGNTPGLIFRGNNQLAGGLGAPVGDGLLCVAGQSARSHVQFTTGGLTSFTDVNGGAFGPWTYGVGARVNYQFWYRDPTNTCSGLGFNWSNAWAVTWIP